MPGKFCYGRGIVPLVVPGIDLANRVPHSPSPRDWGTAYPHQVAELIAFGYHRG